MNKFIKLAILSLIITSSLVSCDKNEEDNSIVTLYLNQSEIQYDDNNIWSNALSAEAKIISQGLIFSHEATPDWGVWSGFIASRNSDTADYSEPFEWLEHQCTAITGGGLSGKGTPYLISYWNTMEEQTVTLSDATCSITYGTEGKTFIPQSVYVTNSSYSYFSMLNGSTYSKKFTTGDYLNLLIYGETANGEKTGPVKFPLAEYVSDSSTPITTWEYVDLEELGEVKGIYFQMESSDTGKWGINTPTYFAIDRLTIKVM